jgi:chemotaxis signal transduction protein
VSRASMASRAADFRNAFDKAFALPRSAGNDATGEDFLTIRIGGEGYAIRLNEIAGLVKGRRIVACPSVVPEFQGIAGVRGTFVSVYSLPVLLGYSIGVEHAPWLLLCSAKTAERGDEMIGFAFPEFSGFVRALPAQIHSASDRDAPSGQSVRTAQFLRIGGEVRPIVAIRRLLMRCLGQSTAKDIEQGPETNRHF